MYKTQNSKPFYLAAILFVVFLLLFLLVPQKTKAQGFRTVPQQGQLDLKKLKLPSGFKISIYAMVPGARSMTLAPDGTLFVGSGGAGGEINRVYRVRDTNKDGKADQVVILKDELNSPNGVAYKDGVLYVAEIDKLLKFTGVESDKNSDLKVEETVFKFPRLTHHGWKFIRFSPSGKLIVPIGAPCNVCDNKKDFARIFELDLKTGGKVMIAEGVRNTVGFDFHPVTKELWFTDNGRDLLGEDVPPCELNKLTKTGEHFGFPYCHGKNSKGEDIVDPEFKPKGTCADYTAPMVNLPAHVAPLGMRFYTGKMFPQEFQGQIFIAEHGSWNRSVPQGYRISLVKLDKDGKATYTPWIEGWLDKREKWGRPVDVEIMKDGSMLISDDYAGVIYRLTY